MFLETLINRVWRPEFEVDATLISAGTEGNADISLVPDQTTLEEGDWVTFNASGKLVLTGATGVADSYPVYIGTGDWSQRATKPMQAPIIYGPHIAKTSKFNNTNLSSAGYGTALAAKSGVLDTAVSGDVVVGYSMGDPADATTAFPNGFLRYSTLNAGALLP
jgi:hypothetical protein